MFEVPQNGLCHEGGHQNSDLHSVEQPVTVVPPIYKVLGLGLFSKEYFACLLLFFF
jgi:hypothetical protein